MRIGITSTIPVEPIVAAGHLPVDLNNRFITAPDPAGLIALAEADGFPRQCCAWIKGIYAVAVTEPVDLVVPVTRGDCSNTASLAEVLRRRGVACFDFEYPSDMAEEGLERAIAGLESFLGVGREAVERARARLAPIRRDLFELDRMTWQSPRRISGGENHRWLVSAGDFGSDPDRFGEALTRFLASAAERVPLPERPRLGVIGVPPIVTGVHEWLEERGAAVVFNEVQRQFAMVEFEAAGIARQYAGYTYPASFECRLADVMAEVARRRIDGVIHYTQTFCHRAIEHQLWRRLLPVPVLPLEGESPGPVDGRTAVRIEAFLEMVRALPPRK